MPVTAKNILKRTVSTIESAKKRAKLPPVTISTRLFYYILSKNDKEDKDVETICQPKPKANLDFTSLEYLIPGLKVPINEEDDNLDLFIEDEGDISPPTELSMAKSKVG